MKLRGKKKQNYMVKFTIQIFSVVMYRQYGNVAFIAVPVEKSSVQGGGCCGMLSWCATCAAPQV